MSLVWHIIIPLWTATFVYLFATLWMTASPVMKVTWADKPRVVTMTAIVLALVAESATWL